jgi:rubrerythrin
MAGDSSSEADALDVSIGTTVYDADGNELGQVRGLDEAGFYVRAVETPGKLTLERARDIFGKAYVMWRCWECGEMGRIEGDLPDECPSCGASKEELYYWAED